MLTGFLKSLSEKPAAAVDIDFNLDDEKAALCQFLKRLKPIVELKTAESWALNIAESTYLGPFAATLILALCLAADKRGQHYAIDFPKNPKVDAYRKYSGLDHWLNDSPLPDQMHPGNESVPLRQVTDTTFYAPEGVISLIRRHFELDQDRETYLRGAISETMQNVEDHSRSPIGAVFGARYLSHKQRIRMAIMDRGDGIFTTLRRKYPDTNSAAMALHRVIKGGFSAKSRQNNMGVGISNLWDFIVRSMGGEIIIVTEDCIAYSRNSNPVYENLGYRFSGTGVFFTVPVSQKK